MADDERDLEGIPAPGGGPREPRVESLTLRPLRGGRSEHAAALAAVTTGLATMRRLYGGLDAVFDRRDALKAELTAFRAGMGGSPRRREGA